MGDAADDLYHREKSRNEENIRLMKFMEDNGLGPEDMRNDITMPENQE